MSGSDLLGPCRGRSTCPPVAAAVRPSPRPKPVPAPRCRLLLDEMVRKEGLKLYSSEVLNFGARAAAQLSAEDPGADGESRRLCFSGGWEAAGARRSSVATAAAAASKVRLAPSTAESFANRLVNDGWLRYYREGVDEAAGHHGKVVGFTLGPRSLLELLDSLLLLDDLPDENRAVLERLRDS